MRRKRNREILLRQIDIIFHLIDLNNEVDKIFRENMKKTLQGEKS